MFKLIVIAALALQSDAWCPDPHRCFASESDYHRYLSSSFVTRIRIAIHELTNPCTPLYEILNADAK